MSVKYSHEEFFKLAIVRLRNTSKSSGIHTVYSGFNQAFREYFKEDPIKVTQELASDGKIELRPVKGGVMIYLPGEAPQRVDSGKKVLSKILKEPPETEKGLVDKVLREIAPKGPKKFPEDFLGKEEEYDEMFTIETPGTPLQLDPNSQTTIISPKRFFKYEARNPSEAKYIIYACEIGQKKVKIPKDNFAVLKAVTGYEKYCHEIAEQCFSLFIKYTNDEEVSELLTKEVGQKLGLKAIRN
ncbi:MAG: hypothetical protein A2170_14135 [Deltaproteobacteria bacterium RBG_13_53_10]|nr:MAG: hypothetical protein A2170_14135 [Deltaproteobacteria bacterium RBG_13_53_10]